jgi:hypothetical protein
MIPILSSIDPVFENLYDTFMVSTYKKYKLHDQFKLRPNYITKYPHGPYGFCTISYSVYRQQHLEYLLSFLEKYPEQEYVISMDADMIFLRGFKYNISNLILSHNNTEVFLSKDSDTNHRIPNIGMMILKNCAQTKNFLNWLVHFFGMADKPCNLLYQSISESLIKHPEYRISLIDENKIIHNNSCQKIIEYRLISNNACCFHATSASNIYDKAFFLSRAMCFLDNRGL